MNMSRAYIRLAQQAEKNTRLDVWYETPSPAPDAR
jgi:hypothetical protein